MPEGAAPKAQEQQKRAAVEFFVGGLMKAAKSVSLYKPGHVMIGQTVERSLQQLKAAVGQEPNIVLEIKAKSVLFDETDLTETPEIVTFASGMHTLGVGQILFTPQITPEGMLQFMKLLIAKPTEEKSLTDLQKDIQTLRIDGMQMVFIQSFVVTGEQEEEQMPGQLTEEQILALVGAKTLPDFLTMLLAQNEPLIGKEPEAITVLLDQVLNRDVSLEKFQEDMPWSYYDERIRERWNVFFQDLRSRKKWLRHRMESGLGVFSEQDLAALKSRHTHEAADAFRFSLDAVHSVMEKPAGERQPKYALFAYGRLLEDLGRGGDLDRLLKECDLWRALATDKKWAAYLVQLQSDVQDRIPSAGLAAALAAKVGGLQEIGDEFQRLQGFSMTLGKRMLPLLLEELRQMGDKDARQRLCRLLAALGRQFGGGPLIRALGDQDYFQVVLVIGVLAEMGLPDLVDHLAPLLAHKHAKVRQTAVRTLGRVGGAKAAEALFGMIRSGEHPEEAAQAVTSVSLMTEPDLDKRLIEAYPGLKDYEMKVAVAAALGRLPSQKTREFLETQAKQSWYEWLSGLNKKLRMTAKASLEQARKETA